jgi:hypothetical protein
MGLKELFGKGKKKAEFREKANVFLYGEGIRLERPVGHTLLKFKSESDDAEIVGELLSALMR